MPDSDQAHFDQNEPGLYFLEPFYYRFQYFASKKREGNSAPFLCIESHFKYFNQARINNPFDPAG